MGDIESQKRLEQLRRIEKKLRTSQRKLTTKIENQVREEFGFRKIGERWIAKQCYTSL